MSDRQKCLLFVFVCLGILGLVSCAGSTGLPPTPSEGSLTDTPTSTHTPTPTPSSTSTPTLTPTIVLGTQFTPGPDSTPYRDDAITKACAEILPFDKEVAFKISPPGEPILWAFGINFSVNSPDPPHNPMGCFSLYKRTSQSFELIRQVLVDTCAVTNRDQVKIDIEHGVANFDGGYIACEMNLKEWVGQLAGAETSNARHLLDVFSKETEYDYANFTIAAKASISVTTNAPITMPVIFYQPPTPVNPATPTYVSPELSLNLENASGDWKWLNCDVTLEGSSHWWYDITAPTPEQFAYQPPTPAPIPTLTSVPASPFPHAIPTNAQVCGSGPDRSPLKFSHLSGTLYLGYNPATGEVFWGTMDGMLIDPTDSKPVLSTPTVSPAPSPTPSPSSTPQE